MTIDLEAALREAREAIAHVDSPESRILARARIDAALSAASGEANGEGSTVYIAYDGGIFLTEAERDAHDKEKGLAPFGPRSTPGGSGEASGDARRDIGPVESYDADIPPDTNVFRPAPSEAPNVERPTLGDDSAAEAWIRSRGYPSRDRTVSWLSEFRAQARAEGIAAERERLRQALVSAYYQGGRTGSEAQRCADEAIRAGAKP